MANLDANIKKYLRGERAGIAATVFCGAVLAYFIICFTVARVENIKALELATLVSAPVLIIIGAAAAAFCNVKYGGAVSRAVKNYVRDVCVENASLFHPERNSLSFYFTLNESAVELQVNGYKEKIIFDFSDFGRLSVFRKADFLSEIQRRLIVTFVRLYERGAEYSDVCFAENVRRSKRGKSTYIIKDGAPELKIYKYYKRNV